MPGALSGISMAGNALENLRADLIGGDIGKISDNEDADLAEAITRMLMADAAYSATLLVTSQGFRPSRMDFLR